MYEFSTRYAEWVLNDGNFMIAALGIAILAAFMLVFLPMKIESHLKIPKKHRRILQTISVIIGFIIFLTPLFITAIGQRYIHENIYEEAMAYFEQGDWQTTKEMLEPLQNWGNVNEVLEQCKIMEQDELTSLREFYKQYNK